MEQWLQQIKNQCGFVNMNRFIKKPIPVPSPLERGWGEVKTKVNKLKHLINNILIPLQSKVEGRG